MMLSQGVGRRWEVAVVMLLASAAAAGGPPPASAGLSGDGQVVPVANWHNPYGNIDPRNDAGNDTGDSQVDQLNAAQLNQNYRGPWYIGRPPPPGVRPPPGPPGYYARPGAYAPFPPPGYP